MTLSFSDSSERFWRLVGALKGAPASEKGSAFEMLARHAANLVGPEFPRTEAADRLLALAGAHGLIEAYGDDGVQEMLARAFAEPADDNNDGGLDAEETRPPAFSDEALALGFAEQHAEHLRYVAVWGRWLRWDGVRWRSDDTLYAFHLARRRCREAAHSCDKPKISATLASAKTVAAVERLARSDRRIAATTDQWDTDLWALNTPAGVVDLRTGDRRFAAPHDYMTKVTGVAPDSSCPIPTWLRFLDRICGGNAELVAFLQRMSGYALTGVTSEHALFFIYGTGANGKSTFLNALTGCLGDYHRTSAIETFTASTTERHPTDLAALRGARLVTAVETEEGRRWAESKIKSLTGGDRIAARFMRQDFFEFTPTFKLIIAGNHKPGLRSVDEAIRRRFHLVPFTVTVPLDERDEALAEKLKSEWPGILAWSVQGCLHWRVRGLDAPEVVRTATHAYLEAEDALAAWIEDEGDIDLNAWEASADLFRSWKNWADRSGEYHGSIKKFSQRLEDRAEAIGIRKGRDGQGRRGFYGLRVTKIDLVNRPDEPPSAAT
ncbi:MAG: phage/plasmid primase, P4 family [Xanthobacteraceae bacterium]|jgi:putative DNA primase/helicase